MPTTYDDLRAVFINCTLKRSPEISNTQGLADLSIGIMRKQGVQVEVFYGAHRVRCVPAALLSKGTRL